MSLHPIPIDDSMAAEIPYGGLTKRNEVNMRGRGHLVGYSMRGPSHEGTLKSEVKAIAARYARGISLLGERDIVHAIINRLPASEYPHRSFPSVAAQMIDDERARFFEQRHYWQTLAHFWSAYAFESGIKSRASASLLAAHRRNVPTVELQADRYTERLATIEDALSDPLGLRRLAPIEMFRLLNLAINGQYLPLPLPPSYMRWNEVLSNQRWHRGTRPWIGKLHQRPISILQFPNKTSAQMLATILRHPGQMTLCLRWIAEDAYQTQGTLDLEQGYWWRESLGTVVDMIARTMRIPPREGKHADAAKQIKEIDKAKEEAAGGLAFGWLSITAIVWDTDPMRADTRADDLIKDLAPRGLIASVEDFHAVRTIMSTWPGNGWHNVRRPLMSADNLSELSLPVYHYAGTRAVESRFFPPDTAPALIVGGSGREPFYLPTHIDGVANTLVIGRTQSGKSALLGTQLAAITGLPKARAVVIDLDYSSYVVAHAIGATYRELAGDGSSAFCPFIYLDDPDGETWLFEWFRRLFLRWDITLTATEATDITEALRLAKELNLRTMTLFSRLVQTPRLREVLTKYTGKWRHVFDGTPNSNASALDSQVTVFETRPLTRLGPAAEAPAIELILHEIERSIGHGPMFVFIDEAWRRLSDPVSSDWLWEAIRTVSKQGAGFGFYTQGITEVAQSDYCTTLLENCPIKIFLPNSSLEGEYVREAYSKLGLSEREIAIIREAIPKRQYFFHSEKGKRLFQLDLQPIATALCASTSSEDVAEAREVLKRYGREQFWRRWLQHKGVEAPTDITDTAPSVPTHQYVNGAIHVEA